MWYQPSYVCWFRPCWWQANATLTHWLYHLPQLCTYPLVFQETVYHCDKVFGAEFVAMKQGMEALQGLHYKLRMMGVKISGPSYIYGDNMSVIHNTQWPELTLKKKSNAVCYHAVHESVAMGESLTGHVSSTENPADLCTKFIPGGRKSAVLGAHWDAHACVGPRVHSFGSFYDNRD